MSEEYGNAYNCFYGADYDTPPPGIAGVTRDSTSSILVPSNSTEWGTFLTAIGSTIPVPSHLYLLQEASGNALDAIGVLPLVASGALVYSKVISGWNRTAIGGTTTAGTTSLTNSVAANIALNSTLALAFISFTTPPVSIRNAMDWGSVSVQLPAVSNKLRLRESPNLADTTGSHTIGVHPILVSFNNTNTSLTLYTDLEKITITWTAGAGSFFRLIGSVSGDTVTDWLYAATWEGSAAETTDAQAKLLIQGLGYSPTWT